MSITASVILRMLIPLCLLIAMASECSAQSRGAETLHSPARLSTQAKSGKQIYSKLNCSECHSIGSKGGCLAPALDGVGGRRSSKYIELRLSDKAEDKFIDMMGHPELFPHPRYSSAVVKQLAAYLLTLPDQPRRSSLTHHKGGADFEEKPLDIEDFKPMAISAATAEGRRLFLEGGCMACHSIGGGGGSVGPALDGIGARHSRTFIEAHISNPQGHVVAQNANPKARSRMPQFDFSSTDVSHIADFLMTLPVKAK